MDIEKKKITFIINPISGTKSKDQILKCIDEYLDTEQYIPEIVYTERAGHAIEIAAQKAKEKAFAVVAIGGDGTINEVAKSLIHTETALGIIPCGSGNGLARHLGISLTPQKAIDVINKGNVQHIDYGLINEHPFFCTCGVGFDAFVSLKFAEAGKRGKLTYIEKTLKEGLSYKPETYELEMDGSKLHYKAFLIACGNASQYGNNAYITPQARITDGLLDVTIIEPFTVLEAPSIALQLFTKTINQNSHIKSFKCRSLHIHRTQEGVAHYDGDPVILGEDINVKVIEQGLRVLTPTCKEEKDKGLSKAKDYINDLDDLVGGFAQKNKLILKKGKRQMKKILS